MFHTHNHEVITRFPLVKEKAAIVRWYNTLRLGRRIGVRHLSFQVAGNAIDNQVSAHDLNLINGAQVTVTII